MTRSDLALAALACAAVPGMKPVSVIGVRPDPDQPTPRHQVAFVEDATGRRWVVRVPLDPAAGAELERNDALVRLLGRHVPFKVPAAAGYADVGDEGRAAVYPYVDGSALRFRQLPPGAGLASAVGRAIAAVHNIPRGLFEEAAVPVFDAAGFRRRKLAELDRAAETGHVPTGLLARWEQALEAAPLWQFATTPIHGQLDGSSLLVAFADDDAASGRVLAMTGWEHAQVADPAEDLAALVEQAAPRAFDAVVDSYALARSQRPDPHIVQRARLSSEMRLLTGLARAVAAGDHAFVQQRADRLRKLDRLTSADDSLVPRTALVAVDPRGWDEDDDETGDVPPLSGPTFAEPAGEETGEGLGGEETGEIPPVDAGDPESQGAGDEPAAEESPDAEDDRASDEHPGGQVPAADRTEEIPLPADVDRDLQDYPGDDIPDEDVAAEDALTQRKQPTASVSGPGEVSDVVIDPGIDMDEAERLRTLYDMPGEDQPGDDAETEDETTLDPDDVTAEDVAQDSRG